MRHDPAHVPATRDAVSGLGTRAAIERETEVIHLASCGVTDREIAKELVLPIRTVQSHLASACRKLGIASRSEPKR